MRVCAKATRCLSDDYWDHEFLLYYSINIAEYDDDQLLYIRMHAKARAHAIGLPMLHLHRCKELDPATPAGKTTWHDALQKHHVRTLDPSHCKTTHYT